MHVENVLNWPAYPTSGRHRPGITPSGNDVCLSAHDLKNLLATYLHQGYSSLPLQFYVSVKGLQ